MRVIFVRVISLEVGARGFHQLRDDDRHVVRCRATVLSRSIAGEWMSAAMHIGRVEGGSAAPGRRP